MIYAITHSDGALELHNDGTPVLPEGATELTEQEFEDITNGVATFADGVVTPN